MTGYCRAREVAKTGEVHGERVYRLRDREWGIIVTHLRIVSKRGNERVRRTDTSTGYVGIAYSHPLMRR